MPAIGIDQRNESRKQRDEEIAAQPPLSPPELPPTARPLAVEQHLLRLRRRPKAFLGIVENGTIRPLEANVQLPERSSVIIVAAE